MSIKVQRNSSYFHVNLVLLDHHSTCPPKTSRLPGSLNNSPSTSPINGTLIKMFINPRYPIRNTFIQVFNCKSKGRTYGPKSYFCLTCPASTSYD